jgi:hypothetical protein
MQTDHEQRLLAVDSKRVYTARFVGGRI